MEKAAGWLRVHELNAYLFSSRSRFCCNSVNFRIATGFPIVSSTYLLELADQASHRLGLIAGLRAFHRVFQRIHAFRELLGRLAEILIDEF